MTNFPLKFYEIKSNTSEYQRRRAFIIIIRGGTKICTITSRFWKLQYGLFYRTTRQFKKLIERNKYNSSSTRCYLLISFYSFFNSNLFFACNKGNLKVSDEYEIWPDPITYLPALQKRLDSP